MNVPDEHLDLLIGLLSDHAYYLEGGGRGVDPALLESGARKCRALAWEMRQHLKSQHLSVAEEMA